MKEEFDFESIKNKAIERVSRNLGRIGQNGCWNLCNVVEYSRICTFKSFEPLFDASACSL